MAQGVSYEVRKLTLTLPYNFTESIEINGIANTSLEVKCAYNTNCNFTTPITPNISFFNGSNSTNLLFDIYIPNGTKNGIFTERFGLFINSSDMIGNFSIDFTYNVSVPEIIEPPEEIANITITKITPANKSKFGKFSDLPEFIRIDFDGNIDYAASDIRLKLDDVYFTDYELMKLSDHFRFSLNDTPEGIYTGDWELVDNHGYSKMVHYSFEISFDDPAMPSSIFPDKGSYDNEIIDLAIIMDSDNYSMQYIIYDGYPPIGNSGWTSLSYVNGQYVVDNFNFGNADIGAMYVKITDIFGNIAVYPTGIISSPGISFELETSSKTVNPGDQVIINAILDIKKGSGTNFRCKMSNFIANENDDDEVFWSIKGYAQLRLEDDENENMDLIKDFDETIELDDKISRESFELVLDVPLSAKTKEDFDSVIECILI